MRRFIASVAVTVLVAAGLTVLVGGPAQATQTYGTITGTVSFAAAPSWESADHSFAVALIGPDGQAVPTRFVPISYGYDGGSGYTITYPNSSGFYNDYFEPGSFTYTVAIYPSNTAYQATYLGGLAVSRSTSSDSATQLDLSSLPSQVAAGNTSLPILASISGTVTAPNGFPAGGIQAAAVPTGGGKVAGLATVNSDGSYHIVGLVPGSYNVGFVPKGTTAGPGAGVWWNSKASSTGATAVTLTASQQKTGVNQSLPKGGVITGVMKDSQGRRVVGGGGVAIYDATGTSDSTATLVQQTYVAADGTFQFWNVPVGKYKLGFDTGTYPPAASSLSVRNLDGSSLKNALPTVDLVHYGAANPDGTLGTSTYPYISAWYTGSAATFSTAKTVSVSYSGQIVPAINGVLPVAASFSAWQTNELTASRNLTEKPVTCQCADPVDTLSGEFSESTTDLSLPGAGLPVQLSRTYATSLASVDGPFGWGGSSSLNMHLVEVPGTTENPNGTVVVTQENGSTTTFTTITNRLTYLAPARVNATLTYDWSHNQWVFTRDATDVLRFTSAGAIVSHQDLHGNVVAFGTDGSGNVTSIAGSGGRQIDLTWTAGLITSATDSAGRTVTYGYDAAGELASFTAADGRATGYGYDSNHQITTVTAPGGGVTTNVYDGQSRVTSQTDALGRVTGFAYSGTAADATTSVTNPVGTNSTYHYLGGILVSRTEAAGTSFATTVSYAYDAALDVTKQVDALGKATIMTYDTTGDMLTSTDPLGHTTSYTYDSLHDVLSVTDALGRISTATYDSTGSKTSATSPSGAVNSWTFNPDGTQASSTDPLGQAASYSYTPSGQLASTTDPLGRISQTSYDTAGHPVGKTDATNATSTMTVDALGRPLVATDALGNVTQYAYDADGNRSQVTAPDGTTTASSYDANGEVVSQTNALGKITTTTYTPLGKVATVTNPVGGVITTAYDLFGRPISVTDPAGLKSTTTYDKTGKVLQVRSPAGNITKAAYDAAGRKITSTDPIGNVTTLAYDVANELISTTDALNRLTLDAYNADGRLATVTGPDGHTETSTYDAAGHQTSFTDADGNITSYSYDAAGQITSRTAPGGLVTSYSYNPVGQVSVLTKPDSSTITDSYNASGQLISATPSTGTATTYSYDVMSRRSAMTDQTGTTSYQYSATGQLTTITNGAAQTVTYIYDAGGRLTTLGYPGNKAVTYAYDADARMTSLTDWSAHKFSFTWTADSLPSKQTDPNKVATTTTYNKDDQVSGISIVNTQLPTTTLATYQYGHDAGSQLTSATLSDPLHTATGGVATSYGYDPRGQLTTVSTGGSFAATPGGSLTQTSDGTTNSYNSSLQLVSASNASAGTSTSFTYDGNGARASQSESPSAGTTATTFAHSWDGSISSVTPPTGTVSYTSNGDGLRQSRTDASGTRQWLWDATASIPRLLSDGANSYLYGPGGTPVAQIASTGTTSYLHGDNIGSVRLVTNSGGTVAGTADFTPFGAQTMTGTPSSIGYAGSWTDQTTGLDYLRARQYDPASGQFLEVDPAQDSTRQLYSYVGNSPLNTTDPTGLCIGLDGTVQDRACTANDFFWAGLPGEVNASLCGTSDAWTCAVQKLDPVYAIIAGVDTCSHSSDPFTCDVQTFDPVYRILDGAGRLPQDIQNGCGLAIASDVTEIVGGAASTVGIAGGGVLIGRAAGLPGFYKPPAVPQITFGHGARHLDGTGLSVKDVEGAITNDVKAAAAQSDVSTGSFWGHVTVSGTTIEYRAYTLADGTINVGTYYVP